MMIPFVSHISIITCFSDSTVIPQGNKGAFLNPLVSACLAIHLKKTINNVIQYGYPLGALAITAAVVRLNIVLYHFECF